MFVTRRKYDELELKFLHFQKDIWDTIAKMNDGRKGDLELMKMLHDQINTVKKLTDTSNVKIDAVAKAVDGLFEVAKQLQAQINTSSPFKVGIT